MSLRDRTSEFHSACQTILNRSSPSSAPSLSSSYADNPARLRSNFNSNGLSPSTSSLSVSRQPLLPKKQSQKSEFAMMAGKIAREIQATTAKLEKLGMLAKRKSLFDDRPVEITELTAVIKQDIQNLNRQIAALQNYVKSQNTAKNKQAEEHNGSVLVSLQSSLANTSKSFADVLEVRTANMKAQKDRRDQFSVANIPSPSPMSNSPLLNYSPKSQAPQQQQPFVPPSQSTASPNSNSFVSIDMSTGQMSQQQVMMIDQQNQYIDSRSNAIESIESTIAELGQIFQQLGQLVAQQREQVMRIDANVEDIETNISGAQRELLKYYNNISSNRWLMLKVFAVVIVFYMIFVFLL
ncbi:t-SNARE [Paraphysoderma sedebokerense]|nr:t-SNARE [Paraphysoderma sedebokerense]